MKTSLVSLRASPRLALVLCLPPLLPAASLPAAPARSATEAEAVQLSPFVVNTDRDTGFAAASSFAGGRLATDLQDTPAAYSVVTRDFIDALGLTDLNAASEWTTNTFKFPDGAGGGDIYNLTYPINVRGVNGVGGLRQRNFFIYFAPMDSYSIERYDFGRGPNQVLFGNGSVGGTSVSMTKRARFDQPRESLELNYGSWDNFRGVIDVNRPFGERVAVRASAVWANRGGWRDYEMEKTQAAFLTATFKLTRDTELRFEGETGQQQRRTPNAQLADRLGGWDGRTTFSGVMTDAIRNSLTNTGANAGVDRRGSNYFVISPSAGTSAVMNYQNDPMTRGAGDSATTPAGTYTYNNAGNVTFNTSGASILHSNYVPGGLFDRAIANSSFRLPSESFTNSIDAPTITQNFKDVQFTLSHKVGDSLYAEVAADFNKAHNRILNIDGGLATTYLDINRLLPTGATNPNYLRPYGDGQIREVMRITDARSFRAAVAYIKDLGQWGHYSFNLMGGLTRQWYKTYNWGVQTGVPLYINNAYSNDHRNWGNIGYGLRIRNYWGDKHPYAPPVGQQISYVDPVSGTNSTVTPFWAYDVTSFNNANEAVNDYNYLLGAMNAKFFRGRWVVLGAARYDSANQTLKYTKLQGDYPENWDGQSIIWRPSAPSNWNTLSYVPKDANGNPTGPATLASVRPRTTNAAGISVPQAQYANDRFQDDFNPPDMEIKMWNPSAGTVFHLFPWLSTFYNYSRALALNASNAPDPFGNPIPAVKGWGWDSGLRFTLFKGKVNLTATTYGNFEYGNYIDPSSVTNNINSLYQANLLGDTSSGGRNIRNMGDISSVVRDTRTRIVNGYEFEAIVNLTRGWRTMANAAFPKVWQKDYAPITRRYAAEHAAVFKQILEDAGGAVLDSATNVATVRSGVSTTGTEAQQAVNAYNNIYNNLKNFLPDLQRATTSPMTLNVFTDYTLQEGRIKGLRAGFGANYRGRRVIGYRGADTIANPANPSVAIDDPTVDGHNVVWGGGQVTYTGTLSYTKRLQDRRELLVSFRVNNLFNSRALIWTDTTTTVRPRNGDYTSPARVTVPNPFAYQVPLSFTLSTTLRM